MTKIDQFESVFKAATRTLFHYEALTFSKVLLVTDLDDEYEVKMFGERVRTFLHALGDADKGEITWRDVSKEECSTIGKMLEVVEAEQPDLICTYRNLHSGAWKWPYTLGSYLDVLTQVTHCPILVLPRPEKKKFYDDEQSTQTVMAVTDHLTGDDNLVNMAAAFTHDDGTLWLSHMEDQSVFERYMQTTEKIPEIDSDTARRTILAQLLKDPHDFITSCRDAITKARPSLTIEESIALGDRLSDYKKLAQAHDVDLLVLNTKDHDQLAMHGLAYPLAIELRDLPILML